MTNEEKIKILNEELEYLRERNLYLMAKISDLQKMAHPSRGGWIE